MQVRSKSMCNTAIQSYLNLMLLRSSCRRRASPTLHGSPEIMSRIVVLTDVHVKSSCIFFSHPFSGEDLLVSSVYSRFCWTIHANNNIAQNTLSAGWHIIAEI